MVGPTIIPLEVMVGYLGWICPLNFKMETKIECSRLESVKRRLGFTACVGINPIDRKGGLAQLWRNLEDLEILNFS